MPRKMYEFYPILGKRLFNISPNSYTDHPVPGPSMNRWRVLFSSDDATFGGHDRVAQGMEYEGGGLIYLPSRTCIVLERV